jgi:hypothetical protein
MCNNTTVSDMWSGDGGYLPPYFHDVGQQRMYSGVLTAHFNSRVVLG